MAAVADTNKLLSQLPPDTAESVLSWLSSRGKDLPVHIPVKTIRFARECFQLIDTDGSGTLEPSELRAVFMALGRPASLRQVSRLVESVAGAGATSLRFSDFAQMMHGAVSNRRREEAELHALMQADVNLGGQAGGGGPGGDGEDEPPLQWTDFHLLAKAFRRRVVVEGVINNSAGWREKVLSLAEKQAANSRAATANAASLWRHRAARLGRKGGGSGTRAATAAAEAGGRSKPGTAASAGSAGSAASARQVGGEDSDMLAGAVSAEATPRAGLGGTDIVVDESPREQAGQDVSAHSSGTDGSGLQVVQQAQHAAVQQARQAAAAAQPQRQMSPIVQQLVSRLRSNAAVAADAGATGSEQQALAALRTISGSMGRSRPGSASHAAVPSPLSRAASRAVAGTAAASNAAANSVTAASSGFSSADGGKLSQRWLSHPGLSLWSCLSRPAGQGQPQEQPPGTPAVSAFAGGSFSAAGASAGGDIGGGSTSMPGNGQGPLPQDAAETGDAFAAPGPASDAASEDAEAGRAEEPAVGDGSSRSCRAGGGKFDWRSTAARMHQAAAASRAADSGPGAAVASVSDAGAPAGGTTTPRPGSLGVNSRLLVPTASSRARTAPGAPAVRSVPPTSSSSDAGCSLERQQHVQQMRRQAGRPVAQAQRRRLAALAMVRGSADSA